MKKSVKYNMQVVEDVILEVRGQRVILDVDLARLYGVETKRLNEQVRRNAGRFPADFMFEVTRVEFANLMSQNAISSSHHGGRRKLPLAFTEHGAIMAANVLKSRQAIEMSIFVVRAFIKMREQLIHRGELKKRFTEIEKVLLSHDTALRDLYKKIRPLLLPPPDRTRKKIGFDISGK